jgi:hypothetical protein
VARFRDSHGRFSSRPRDSAGRYRSESWYNRSQGQKARYQAAAEHARRSYAASIGWQTRRRSEAELRGWQTRREKQDKAGREYSVRRAAEIAAEYEAAAERFAPPAPVGAQLRQRQDAWGLQEIGRVGVEPGAHVEVKIELGGRIVYEYDGRADEFAPLELRRALDEWSVEYLEDDAHYWRAPELRIWQIDKTLNPQTLQATAIKVSTIPGADAILQEDIDTHGKGPIPLTGEAPMMAEWPQDDDALPE